MTLVKYGFLLLDEDDRYWYMRFNASTAPFGEMLIDYSATGLYRMPKTERTIWHHHSELRKQVYIGFTKGQEAELC